MGILKRVLIIVGILLCLYPMFRRKVTRYGEREIISEYQKDPSESDAIGVLEIPKIDLQLPIYEGTAEPILEKGIGHIEESSPIDTEGDTHCLLAGHRGLPDAELFTRLGEVSVGDIFHIEVNNNRYTYRVFKIRVVKSDETEELGIQENRDLVSLITCTPYGINTHRLIVTGERMEGKE